MKLFIFLFTIHYSLFTIHCYCQVHEQVVEKIIYPSDVKVGAERTELYFPLIRGKNIGIVANHTSRIKRTNLVDSLINAGFKVKKIFSPEHGFYSEEEAGANINNGVYKIKTSSVQNPASSFQEIPIISLYGKNKKPSDEDLKGLDIVIFDIQDVGVRFYTYISTLHYVMEACAENKILLIILDRPNPNGFYIDGPVLEEDYKSFVGLDRVPLVYGMTLAEYARMLNGEGWLENSIKCDLICIQVTNYAHSYYYQVPVKPSPNLINMESIYLYPSLGLLEGTVMSVGRGTDKPFLVLGHPDLPGTHFSFTPHSIKGMSEDPPYKGIKCNGYYLSYYANSYIKSLRKLYLYWLIESYKELSSVDNRLSTAYFNSFFDKLAGTATLRRQIINGVSEDAIRNSWAEGIKGFKNIRKKYLLYPDFE